MVGFIVPTNTACCPPGSRGSWRDHHTESRGGRYNDHYSRDGDDYRGASSYHRSYSTGGPPRGKHNAWNDEEDGKGSVSWFFFHFSSFFLLCIPSQHSLTSAESQTIKHSFQFPLMWSFLMWDSWYYYCVFIKIISIVRLLIYLLRIKFNYSWPSSAAICLFLPL